MSDSEKTIHDIIKAQLKEKELDVIFSVITRLELQKLKVEIAKIDDEAFVVENSVNDITGGMIKKRPLQK